MSKSISFKWDYPLFILSSILLLCSNLEAQQTILLENNSETAFHIERADWFRFEPQFNYDSTIYHLKRAIGILETQEKKAAPALTDVYLKLASCYLIPAQKDSALNRARYYSELTNDNLLKYRVLYSIANKNWHAYDISGKNIFSEANKLIQDDKDPSVRAEYEFGLGCYYIKNTNSIDFAIHCLNNSLSFYIKKEDYESLKKVFLIYNNFHNILFVENKMDSAEYYLKKLELLLPHLQLAQRLSYLGLCINFHKTLKHFDQANAYGKEYGDLLEKYGLMFSQYGQSFVFTSGHIKFLMGDYENALKNYKQAIAIGDSLNLHGLDYDLWNYTAQAYEKKDDFANAYKAQQNYLHEAVKRLDLNHHNSVKELEIQYGLKDKEQEMVKQAGQRNMLITLVLSLIMVAILLAYFNFKSRKTHRIIAQQAEVLQKLDATKSRFFANVSHELRTPLTLMLSPLSTMIKSGTLDNRNFTLASLVRQNGQNLLQLVNEILDLNKLEAGKLELREEPIVVYTLIRRIVANFESAANVRQIHFIFNYKVDKYLQLLLDKDKVRKVFNNLLSNAVKFTPANGSITVTVEDKHSHLSIKVADTGRGIHPDDMPRVFDRFYQSNQPDAPVEGGTGIGLSLSMELAKLMQGRLSVESTYGKGATFTFELPKKEVLNTVSNEDIAEMTQDIEITEEVNLKTILLDDATGKNNKETILIVEDNQSLRDYLSLILKDKYHVIKAENGQVALNFLNKVAIPNLILSDMMMPVMDGFQLLSTLKSHDKYCQIPVIMLTARAEMQDKLKALRIGVDDYLTKPFEEEELSVRIANLLQNARLRQVESEAIETDKTDEIETEVINTPSVSAVDMAWLADLEMKVKQSVSDMNYSVERMAFDMALSRTQLFRKLKQLTGLSPQQYLQVVRLQQALYLLETQQEHSVKAVCYAVGLLQVKHFSQLFQERFGRLPSSYLQ